MLHRDLKTQNVLVTKDTRVKIGDFGISKKLENTEELAKTSLGTPYYLSPEIINGNPYDYKSDAWMLGCVLYEMCTLKRPFTGDSFGEVLKNILRSPYEPLDVKRFDPIFNEILQKLLNKEHTQRASI